MIERRDDGRVMVFTGGVVVRQADLVECADRVTIHLDATRTALVRTVASGNVRIITSDGREGTAARAEYRAADYRVVLSGRARLSPDEGWPSGDDIFVYLPAD